MGACPDLVKRLIDRFDQQSDQVRSPDYNETTLRIDFVNPMFHCLGWDIDNTQGFAEQYREVVHEDRVKIAGATKAPDYSFRIGGTRKFFLEAKKPAVNIKTNPEPAYQLRRYGWSAKLAISLLTDFEELAIYDCRKAPKHLAKASDARRELLTYRDYISRWDFIEGTFSKSAVLRGDFDRYCQTAKGRGADEFDDAFLNEIEDWRKKLASNLALRNDNLDQPGLNFAVQRIIDRIIFLRICEDRGTEHTAQLQALLNGDSTYPRLLKLFRDADARYNSGLFHFQKEKDRDESPDELTPALDIDDATLKHILRRLYYPDSPYEFSVVSADILGSVYERFLGNIITLTDAHRAKIEQKPDVRKAGGVYYTPTYIVDYIVQNTVGKLLNPSSEISNPKSEIPSPPPPGGSDTLVRHPPQADTKPLTPKDASKLKILDPACGSGSFLIGAYQYLLDWHLNWYIADGPQKWSKGKTATLRPSIPTASPSVANLKSQIQNSWRLTISERKRILLDNIHGVDIDYQAVEVTKLSLLLKCLEGETSESLGGLWTLYRQRALPDLGKNILCGNSLIGTDIMQTDAWKKMSDEERAKINPFDFDRAFPKVFRPSSPSPGTPGEGRGEGGYDAVIGNPPYVFGRDWNALGISEFQKEYLRDRFTSSPYQLDMFSVFMERAFMLTRRSGYVGQIVPNVWLTNTYSSTTRAFYLGNASEIYLAVPPRNVFEGITVDTVVYVLRKGKPPAAELSIRPLASDGNVGPAQIVSTFEYQDGKRPISVSTNPESMKLAERLVSGFPQLGSFAEITRGVHPYRTGGFGRSAFGDGPQIQRDVDSRPYHFTKKQKDCRPFVYGKNLSRYGPVQGADFISYGPWLAEPRDPKFFVDERIYSRKILAERLIVTLETSNSVADQQVYITKITQPSINPRYVLGVIASRSIAAFIRSYFDEATEAFPQIKVAQLRQLPIPITQNSKDATKLIALVDSMLSLHTQLRSAKLPQQQEQLRRQIESTDRQIDSLVYQLYGLTDAEIKIVEEATK